MLDSPDVPNCPAPPDAGALQAECDALRAELARHAQAIADRDRSIAELAGRLEEARLTLLWQRTEIAARDRRIADLWQQADGLNQAMIALQADRDAAPEAPAGVPSRPRRSLLGLLSRRGGGDATPTADGDGERPRRVA